jgi:hypothetical protein
LAPTFVEDKLTGTGYCGFGKLAVCKVYFETETGVGRILEWKQDKTKKMNKDVSRKKERSKLT